jgi:Cft2 family RNA processing exonuclease
VTCINSDVKVLKDWAHSQELKSAKREETPSVVQSKPDTCCGSKSEEVIKPIEKPKRKYAWKRKPGYGKKIEAAIESQATITEEK